MKKVLYLEDEVVIGGVYTKHLERAGFQVFWARTIAEFSAQVPIFLADIVLLDQGMRGETLSGIDLVSVVRQYMPNAYVLLLSNYSHFQIEEGMKKNGVDAYLLKIQTPPAALVAHLLLLFPLSKDSSQILE